MQRHRDGQIGERHRLPVVAHKDRIGMAFDPVHHFNKAFAHFFRFSSLAIAV
jgi:hypothetical protein